MNNNFINIYDKEKNSYILEVLIIILVVILVLMTIYSPTEVNGTSMLPRIESGDVAIMVSRNPKRGDIVIVKANKPLIKRLIGLPGDTIEFRRDGDFVRLYLNESSEETPETYIKERMLARRFLINEDEWHAKLDRPFTLGSDEYYVCGDNRNVSEDSRSIGPVTRKQIEGVAVKIFKADSFMAKMIKFIYKPENSNGDARRNVHAPAQVQRKTFI